VARLESQLNAALTAVIAEPEAAGAATANSDRPPQVMARRNSHRRKQQQQQQQQQQFSTKEVSLAEELAARVRKEESYPSSL